MSEKQTEFNAQLDKTYKLMTIGVLLKHFIDKSITVEPERQAYTLIMHHAMQETKKLAKMFK